MKSIVCELCGSTEFTRDSEGLFVCDYCRAKYSQEQAKSMMVEGVVRLDRSSDIEPFLKIARDSSSSGDYDNGILYSNKVLEIDPENSEAHFLKAVSLGKSSTLERLRFEEMDLAFQRAIEFCVNSESSLRIDVAELRWNLGASVFDMAIEAVRLSEISRLMWENFIRVAVPSYEQISLAYTEFSSLEDSESSLKVLEACVRCIDAILMIAETRNRMPAGNWGPGDWGTSWLSAEESSFWSEQRANAVSLVREIDPERAPKDKSCFIATASIGLEDHFLINTLRRFRDVVLLRHQLGIDFVTWYYRHGSTAALHIRRSRLLRLCAFLLIVLPAFMLALLWLACLDVSRVSRSKFPELFF